MAQTFREKAGRLGFVVALWLLWLFHSCILYAWQELPCLNRICSKDALLVADPGGRILFKQNEEKKCIPASTIKLLTALTAIHHLGNAHRFRTEFYLDPADNLKIKGYGDPLLISEALKEMADSLAQKIHRFNDLTLDDTYFSHHIKTPWLAHSTNPYDAPVGALCANFNTVFFDRDHQGRIISAEPQTPMIPYAQEKIRSLGLEKGRYTFTHERGEAVRYAGELFLHFLRERGVKSKGKCILGAVGPGDRLIHVYRSGFTLEQAIEKMMEFSNNFMANQILIALGAREYGPPGTLAKGIRAVSEYARNELELKEIEIVEGSGISRKNRLSPLHMLAILKRFKPYRHLLKRRDNVIYKTGTLSGISTRAGYIEAVSEGPFYFAVFLNQPDSDMEILVKCLQRAIAGQGEN